MKTEMKLGRLKMSDIENICGGRLVCLGVGGENSFLSLCTDSREADYDTLFIALKGEKVDGHDYISAAMERGCSCVIAERVPKNLVGTSVCILVVDNTVSALGKISNALKKKIKCKTVAVTGSVGKTTTKEFIFSVLSQKYKTFKTEGNHNSTIGLPMSVLGMEKSVEAAVLEMGMSDFGEIELMSHSAEPDIAVITTIGTSHLEQLGTRENICRAKMEITSGMKYGGTLILNGDEPLLWEKKGSESKPVFVALHRREAEFRAVNIRGGIMNTTFDLIYGNKVYADIEIPVMGEHNVYAALFAIACGFRLGLDDSQIRAGVMKFRNTGMRQNIYDFEGITVIEDCYNASPESMRSGIDVLTELSERKGGARTAALLGDMLELGENSEVLHRQVGRYLAEKKCRVLFAYGPMAEKIALAATEHGMRAENVYVCKDATNHADMGEILLHALCREDVLLVKASRGMAAEKIIEYIKNNKERLFN